MLPIALQTSCLAPHTMGNKSIKKALHTAAQLEYDGVQIDTRRELLPSELSATGLRQFRKMLDDLNLRVGSVTFPTRRGYGDPADLDRRVQATLEAMKLASELKARTIILLFGEVPELESPRFSMLVDVLETLGSQGNRLGVSIAGHAPKATNTELEALMNALPEGTCGLDLNPAELIAHGHSPQEYAESQGAHIRHIYANDAVQGFGGSGST
ncbi:MAG: TIM barrel protein, partial [Lacipirellulaceae bacterium]